MTSKTVIALIVLEQSDLALLERQRKYLIKNVGQAAEDFGDTKVSIGFYDENGSLQSSVTQKGGDWPPQSIVFRRGK